MWRKRKGKQEGVNWGLLDSIGWSEKPFNKMTGCRGQGLKICKPVRKLLQ